MASLIEPGETSAALTQELLEDGDVDDDDDIESLLTAREKARYCDELDDNALDEQTMKELEIVSEEGSKQHDLQASQSFIYIYFQRNYDTVYISLSLSFFQRLERNVAGLESLSPAWHRERRLLPLISALPLQIKVSTFCFFNFRYFKYISYLFL